MEAAALEIASDVLRSGALAGLLGTEPDDGGAFARDAAALSLVVHLALLPRTHSFLRNLRRALDALAVLERVSHSLGAFPLAKRAFWSRVLDHPAESRSLLASGKAPRFTGSLRYEDPAFPRLVVAFDGGGLSPELAHFIATWQLKGVSSPDLAETSQVLGSQGRKGHVVPVMLRIHNGDLKAEDFDRLEAVLQPLVSTTIIQACGQGDGSPVFRVTGLDLTDNVLDEAGMIKLARVIGKLQRPLDTLARLFESPVRDVDLSLYITEIAVEYSKLKEESEVKLEVLGVREDGWVCVIVPAFGLAWAPPTAVELEVSTFDGSPALRRPVVRELDLNRMRSTSSTTAAVPAFVKSFGPVLESLASRWTFGRTEEDLGVIVTHCSNLKRFDMEGSGLYDWVPLLRALDGPLGRSLRSLNMCGNPISMSSADRITLSLRRPGVVLEELRVRDTFIGTNGLEDIAKALRVNKQLRLLELPLPIDDNEGLNGIYADRTRVYSQLKQAFHDELLGAAPVPMHCKLAFLSVMRSRDELARLDAQVVSLIFEMAATEVRRSIVWLEQRDAPRSSDGQLKESGGYTSFRTTGTREL